MEGFEASFPASEYIIIPALGIHPLVYQNIGPMAGTWQAFASPLK